MTLCRINCASPLPKASAIHSLLQRLWSERTRWFEEWNGKREHVAEQGQGWKFTQPKEGDLRKMILETGDRMLVEASPYDKIWGIGYDAANAEANTGDRGDNLLRKAQVRVRERLCAEEVGKEDETKDDAEEMA